MSKLSEIRKAVADYIASEGCSCCRSSEKHTEAEVRLAKLLRASYPDSSGFDFMRFRSDVHPTPPAAGR